MLSALSMHQDSRSWGVVLFSMLFWIFLFVRNKNALNCCFPGAVFALTATPLYQMWSRLASVRIANTHPENCSLALLYIFIS